MAQDETLAVELTTEQKEAARIKAEETVALWFDAKSKLDVLKEKEMDLRNQVVQYYFPKGLKEGANKADLPEGWGMTVTGVVNRKIDVAVETAVKQEMKEKYEVDAGEFIKYKPELDLPAYRELEKHAVDATGERAERAQGMLKCFQQLLIVTDGSPQVKLTEPKKPKAKVGVV